jgi:hypothetical protein
MIDFIPINHRLHALGVRGRCNSLSSICAHAPMKGCPEYIKELLCGVGNH